MASAPPARTTGGSLPSQRLSSSTIHEVLENNSTSASPPSPRAQRRSSSVRFAEEAMSVSPPSERRHRRTSSTEEIFPIRQAERTTRNYNTSIIEDHDLPPDPTTESPGDEHMNGELSSSQRSEEKMKWYKGLAEKYGSVSLENKGSVARDHLALERTFLAWLRTSLAFASIGIAITQLFRLNTSIASRTQQYNTGTFDGLDRRSVPFSPMLGYSIPFEAMEAFQVQAATQPPPTVPGSTLLDQLLNPPTLPLPPNPQRSYNSSGSFDEGAAAKLRHVGKPLGATFLGVSIVVLFVGFHRYFESQYWIIRGKFPASRGSVALVGFIAGALIVTSLVVVLIIAPTSYEKN